MAALAPIPVLPEATLIGTLSAQLRRPKPWSATSAQLKGFGCRPFADARGPTGAGVRKPRKEETAGRKRRGLVGGELWGFEGRGRIAGAVAGAGGSHSYRWARRRRACSIASIRGPGVSPAPGEGLRMV